MNGNGKERQIMREKEGQKKSVGAEKDTDERQLRGMEVKG